MSAPGAGLLILVIDLEATCADDDSIPPEEMEVIEVGAVWATPGGEAIDTFQRFVRPARRPLLTGFCRSLTHIEQASVDAAPTWPTVATELAHFATLHAGRRWGSWGAYDRHQIERDCSRHGIANPLGGFEHINFKRQFAKARRIKEVGMARAAQIVGLPLDGAHHRGLDDALNIGRLLPFTMQSSTA